MRFSELFESITAYHGSSNEHQGFDTKHTGTNSTVFGAYHNDRHGIFFSLNPHFAALYGDVIEYELNISNTIDLNENPNIVFEFTQKNDLDRNVMLDARSVMYGDWSTWQLFEDELGEEFVSFLKEKGYDSASFAESNFDDEENEIEGKTIVVFNPSKAIKHGQLELDLYESEIPSLSFYNGVTDSHSGQTNGTLWAYDKTKYPDGFDLKQVDGPGIYGYIDWVNYQNDLQIQMIETLSNYRRHGIGTQMVNELKRYAKENNCQLVWSNTTSDGEALKQSLRNPQ